MRKFHDFLNEIYCNTRIPFNIKLSDGEEIKFLSSDLEKLGVVNEKIDCNKDITITTTKNYKNCVPLLKYLIKKQIKDIDVSKKKVIKNLLQNNYVDLESIKDNFPWLLGETFLITIYSKNFNKDILSLINESYSDYNIISLEYSNYIIVIGNLDDIEEQVKGLRDAIYSNLYIKCYISYSKIKNIKEIKEKVDKTFENIDLAMRYNLSADIYEERSLILENIVDNIDNKIKEDIIINFAYGFSRLDGEMSKTIDVFLKSGLNITDAAKKLYIHRNTLVYRLDKIQKYTGYDIRNFNEAMFFKIAFLISLNKEPEK